MPPVMILEFEGVQRYKAIGGTITDPGLGAEMIKRLFADC